MTTKTIDQAKTADLRGSWPALQRAAQRARELAVQTGTELIISRAGVMERIKPDTNPSSQPLQEPQAHDKGKP
ncbi:hypothetical protein [Candidatus Igneacidithiobacillus taiwanensis]|uniref:hypothetical protein n=1 Tax=Candidatus Igneacidithiobacillus taiwanensis TaxID=1945924 RepID=UPI002898535D|nr:hypothetical protein [Candidatus Igneacidithiobacillus taiwanensis]MCE5360427.1 hypothetical protein [Acidithiobacillus sp.]